MLWLVAVRVVSQGSVPVPWIVLVRSGGEETGGTPTYISAWGVNCVKSGISEVSHGKVTS